MTEGCRPSWPGRDDGRLARLGGVIDGPGVGIVSGIFGYAFATAWRTDAHGAVARASTPTYFGSWRRVPAASPDTRFENPRTSSSPTKPLVTPRDARCSRCEIDLPSTGDSFLVGHHAPLTRWRVSPCRASILRPRVAWGVARTQDRADRCPLPRLSPGREWRTRNRRERRSSRRQGTGDRRAPSRRTPVGLRRGLPDTQLTPPA